MPDDPSRNRARRDVTRITRDLRVSQMLRLTPDTICEGDVHAPEGLVLPERVVIEGDVYTDGPVDLGPDCRVEGRIRPTRTENADAPTSHPEALDDDSTINHRVRGKRNDRAQAEHTTDGESSHSHELAARTTAMDEESPCSPHVVLTLLDRQLSRDPDATVERVGPYAALVTPTSEGADACRRVEATVRDVMGRRSPTASIETLDNPSPGPESVQPLLVSL
jgi:hypothetical protein